MDRGLLAADGRMAKVSWDWMVLAIVPYCLLWVLIFIKREILGNPSPLPDWYEALYAICFTVFSVAIMFLILAFFQRFRQSGLSQAARSDAAGRLRHIPGALSDRIVAAILAVRLRPAGDRTTRTTRCRMRRRFSGGCRSSTTVRWSSTIGRAPRFSSARGCARIWVESARVTRSSAPRRSCAGSGLRDFMIQAGGDCTCAGHRDGRPWRLGINDPRGPGGRSFATLDLSDGTFSTSGDYERFFMKDGRRYHHILDPDSGEPARLCRSVTIVADSPTLADAFSTGVFVVGPVAGMALIERLPNVEGVIVSRAQRGADFERPQGAARGHLATDGRAINDLRLLC